MEKDERMVIEVILRSYRDIERSKQERKDYLSSIAAGTHSFHKIRGKGEGAAAFRPPQEIYVALLEQDAQLKRIDALIRRIRSVLSQLERVPGCRQLARLAAAGRPLHAGDFRALQRIKNAKTAALLGNICAAAYADFCKWRENARRGV